MENTGSGDQPPTDAITCKTSQVPCELQTFTVPIKQSGFVTHSKQGLYRNVSDMMGG